jgi:hypothetical protein
MYQNGWGVRKSAPVAEDWYVEAGDRFINDGVRKEALEALEAAMRVVADLPAVSRPP